MRTLGRVAVLAAVLVAGLEFAVALQYAAGAYDAELGSLNSDEAPHYINGLLVARYAAAGFPGSPMAFAAAFYAHYPKVSIGHWPPLFYGVEAVWMLAFSASRASVLVLSAATSAALATTLAAVALGRRGVAVAMLAAVAFLALPLVRDMTAAVLVDVFVAWLELAATLCAIQYVLRPRWEISACFGLLASAAIMTKGNGLAVALVPPIMVALTGRFGLLRRASFWVPVPVAAVLCGPWYAATYALAHDGFFYDWGWGYSSASLAANAGALAGSLGVPCLVLAGIGAAGGRGDEAVRRRGLTALCCAVFAFHVAVPVDLQSRYMIPVFGPAILLAAAGIGDVARRIPAVKLRSAFAALLVLTSAAALLPEALEVPRKPGIGMRAAAASVLGTPQEAPAVLVAAGAPGEGAFVVEMALRGSEAIVARGTKFLASADFNGGHYAGRFSRAADVAAAIGEAGIGFVVLDTAASSLLYPHNRLVQAAAAAEQWPVILREPHHGIDGETIVYRTGVGPVTQFAAACVWRPPAAPAPGAPAFALQKPAMPCAG